MSSLDTEPYFSSEAQETFVPDHRVFLIENTVNLNAGTEGKYLGRYGGEAIVDWDTPSREPRAYVSSAPFRSIKNLYR